MAVRRVARRAAGCLWHPRFATRRRYGDATADEAGAGQDEGTTTRPSGAVVRKGGGTVVVDGPSEEKPWFMKPGDKDQHPLAPYQASGAGDRGFPFSSAGARETPDTRSLSELGMQNKKMIMSAFEDLRVRVPEEIRAKQRQLRLERKSKAALQVLLGDEDGHITLKRRDHVVQVEIIPPRGRITGALMQRLEELIGQLTSMREVTGVSFILRGSITGYMDMKALAIDKARVAQAAAIGQRVANALAHLPVVTVCAFDGRLSGVAAELFAACDFRFATQRSTIALDTVKTGWVGGMGHAARMSLRQSPRRALQLCVSGEPMTAEEAQKVGLVDRVVASPADSAVAFLTRGFDAANWQQVRRLKELVTVVEQMHQKDCLVREQMHFRRAWRCPDHVDAFHAFKVSM
eukprot:TRINITY_DN18308_c0_g1_i1.p2 TRINITY_DN18308_c0_g1~~TRINITY_DN18308_c0_g1_i1.p2  ORF type:complete len:440 (+),score=125.56 TRINITY_DN18308_c0_g1_i1:106-1320(+)